MSDHNHLLSTLRTGIFYAPPGSVLRDWLKMVQAELWTANDGEKPDPPTAADKARGRRLARSVGHRLEAWRAPPRGVGGVVASCRDCKAPLFVHPGGGLSPLYPCARAPKGRSSSVVYRRPTFGRW